jgi:hypothetical protein
MKKIINKKILIIFLLMILINGCSSSEDTYILNGTYVCSEMPFSSMVFDQDDHNNFYFYNPGLKGTEKVDKGNFSKKTDSKYIIDSTIFTKKQITLKKMVSKLILMTKHISLKRLVVSQQYKNRLFASKIFFQNTL